MVTLSPLCTARTMVSTTFSTAAVACRRSEPILSVSTSMSSALFIQNLRNQWSSLDRLEDTVNPLPTDFQEPRAISCEPSELSCPPWRPAEGPENRVERRRFRLAGAHSSRWQSAWFPMRSTRLEGLDFIEFPQRKAYIVKSLEQAPGGVIVNLERHHDRSRDDIPILKIHSDFRPRMLLNELPQEFHIILRDFGRQEARLARIAPKNIGESGRDNDPEAKVHQRPDGMFARRSGAEIGPSDQYRALVEGGQIQNEGRIGAPCREQTVLETRSGD